MFLPMIVTMVILLMVTIIMSQSTVVTNSSKAHRSFTTVKYTYEIEQTIVNAVEAMCQADPDGCLDAESDGVITLDLTTELGNYIPDNFVNQNLFGGSYTSITLRDDDYTTIRLVSNIPNNIDRHIYLKHYGGLKYSIPPLCGSGDEDADVPCDSSEVYHDYPTSLETRGALEE